MRRFAVRLITLLSLLLAAAVAPCTEINQAGEAQLDGIKGIGPALSGRILQAREQHGPFRDWSDLMRRVKGIRPASARQLSAAGLTVNGAPYSAPHDAPPPAAPR